MKKWLKNGKKKELNIQNIYKSIEQTNKIQESILDQVKNDSNILLEMVVREKEQDKKLDEYRKNKLETQIKIKDQEQQKLQDYRYQKLQIELHKLKLKQQQLEKK